MAKLYKVSKAGEASRIRSSKSEVLKLVKRGYTLDGEVDEEYNVIDADPFAKKKENPPEGNEDGMDKEEE